MKTESVKHEEMSFANFTVNFVDKDGKLAIQFFPSEGIPLGAFCKRCRNEFPGAEEVNDFGLNSIYSEQRMTKAIAIDRLIRLDQSTAGMVK